MKVDNVTYFNSCGVEYITKEIRKFIRNKNIIANICRIQAYDSVMCGYFCIKFVDFILNGKSLLEYTKLFSSNEYKKNDKIILNLSTESKKIKIMKSIVMFPINIENPKTRKYHIFIKKH